MGALPLGIRAPAQDLTFLWNTSTPVIWPCSAKFLQSGAACIVYLLCFLDFTLCIALPQGQGWFRAGAGLSIFLHMSEIDIGSWLHVAMG